MPRVRGFEACSPSDAKCVSPRTGVRSLAVTPDFKKRSQIGRDALFVRARTTRREGEEQNRSGHVDVKCMTAPGKRRAARTFFHHVRRDDRRLSSVDIDWRAAV